MLVSISYKNKLWLTIALVALLFVILLSFAASQFKARDKFERTLAERKEALAWMRHAARMVKSSDGNTTIKGTRTLASRVSLVLRQNNLRETDISTNRTNQIIVHLKEVKFTDLHKSLYDLEHRWRVTVKKLSIKRLSKKTGMVTAEFIVEKQ